MISDPGKKAPEVVNVVVEISKGSNVKYEYDMEKDMMRVDRILYTAMYYPFNYGFVAGTKGEDGDPLDILVLSNTPFVTGSLIEARPIGIMLMKDEEGTDSKVIAAPIGKVDPEFAAVSDINELPDAIKKKLAHFFSYYKSIEPGKWVEITGWRGADEAKAEVKKAIARK